MAPVTHRYVIPAETYPCWRALGWRVASQQPDAVLGLLIENENRYPLYPCKTCEQELSELGFISRGGYCAECDDERDAVQIVLH